MRSYLVLYFGPDESPGRRLFDLLDETGDAWVVREGGLTATQKEFAEMYQRLADEGGQHRGCGCYQAPLSTMLVDLLHDFDEAREKLARLERENAQLQTALSVLR